MNQTVPAFLFPYMLFGSLTTLAALLLGLAHSLKTANWPMSKRLQAIFTAAALLAVFYVAALLPSRSGFYHGDGSGSGIPTIQYGLLTPIVIGTLLFLWWRPFRRALDTVPQSWLAGIQLYRAEGVIFLLLYATGRLPAWFALPAGIGDVCVGLLAPLVAIAQARKWRHADRFLRLWNRLGIADLIIAVTAGMLTSPSPLHIFTFHPPNELISQYPLVMIPVFLVPLSILLHLASLQRLRQSESVPLNAPAPSLPYTASSARQPTR
jgi:hypothetical protein